MKLGSFNANPEEVPILYATGLKPFVLSSAERDVLATYIRQGGFFLAVAHHGTILPSSALRRAGYRGLREGQPRPWGEDEHEAW